jgi:hypothetical protein
MPAWCGRVIDHARTDFFRGAALVTRGVLAELALTFQVSEAVKAEAEA